MDNKSITDQKIRLSLLTWIKSGVLLLLLSFLVNPLSAQKTTIVVGGTTYNLDGNPNKWVTILENTTDASILAKSFRRDANSSNDDQWTGGSADGNLVGTWAWSSGSTNDKGDISNAGVILQGKTIYFFGDRTAVNGDAQIGFWFFLGGIKPGTNKFKGGFAWDGANADGDILAISNFINGGGTPTLTVYKRQGANLVVDNSAKTFLAINTTQQSAPNTTNDPLWPFTEKWTFTPKTGTGYPSPLFFEGSIDFTTEANAQLCFTNFLLETRNSQSLTASLQDFVTGSFNVTPPPPTPTGDVKCAGTNIVLTANCSGNNISPQWYQSDGTTPVANGTPTGVTYVASGSTLTISGLAAGSYTYKVSCKNTELNCESSKASVTAIVNPIPTVNQPGNQEVCNGGTTSAVTFTGTPTGVTFTWTNNTTSIGLGASGTGNIAAFTAHNTGSSQVTATITVTPHFTANGVNCDGPVKTYTIKVNPDAVAPDVTYIPPTCTQSVFSVKINNPQVGNTYILTQLDGNVVTTPAYVSGDLIIGNLHIGQGYSVISRTSSNCSSLPNQCGTFSTTTMSAPRVVEATLASQPKVLAAPNPFNDRIRFTLKSDVSGKGTLELYNILGQKLNTVFQGYVNADQAQSIEYSVPWSQRTNLIYVFRVGKQQTSGKLIGLK